jgi:hypothetical protein
MEWDHELSEKIPAGSMAGFEHFQPVQKLPLKFFVLPIPKLAISIGDAYRLSSRHKIRIAIEEFGEAGINCVYCGQSGHNEFLLLPDSGRRQSTKVQEGVCSRHARGRQHRYLLKEALHARICLLLKKG